jgi:LPXTG-motif cell wall-anchored protein
MADEQRAPATNWAQARDRINSGATGDKVAFPDPATTPLGTDAEAGGASTAPEVIAQNVRNEQHHGRPDSALALPDTGASRSTYMWVGIGVAVLLVVVLLAAI